MPLDIDRLNLLLTLGRYADGEKAAREAIAQDPNRAAGYSFLAVFLSHQGHHLAAIRAAKDGIARDPHDAWVHAVLASALDRLGRSDQALAATAEALRLDPTYAFAHRMRCQILCTERRYREARQAALDGLRHHPTDEMLLHWKGWAEQVAGRLATAVKTAEEGLKQHPNSASLRNVLGCALMEAAEADGPIARVRDHRRADAAFREAIRLRPGEPAYQDNRRNNALRCRRYVLKPLLLAVMAASALLAVAGIWATLKGGGRMPPVLLVLGIAAYIPGLVHLNAAEDWFVLGAPLDRLGVPTVPLSPDERRKGRRWWPVVLGAVVGVPAVAWVLALAARH
jgi:tetratricopeptide (TPR) repeat protein